MNTKIKSTQRQKARESATNPKTAYELLKPMCLLTGAALCMGISSCVASYDSPGYAHTAMYSPGYRVTSLPGGYRSEIISGSTYYYHDGYYYRPSSGGYIVVDAPRSSRYYSDYGRRHQTSQPSRGLETQGNNRNNQRYQEGNTLTQLPRGYREVKHRGTSYYQVDGRYYQRRGDRYVIVGRPN